MTPVTWSKHQSFSWAQTSAKLLSNMNGWYTAFLSWQLAYELNLWHLRPGYFLFSHTLISLGYFLLSMAFFWHPYLDHISMNSAIIFYLLFFSPNFTHKLSLVTASLKAVATVLKKSVQTDRHTLTPGSKVLKTASVVVLAATGVSKNTARHYDAHTHTDSQGENNHTNLPTMVIIQKNC